MQACGGVEMDKMLWYASGLSPGVDARGYASGEGARRVNCFVKNKGSITS